MTSTESMSTTDVQVRRRHAESYLAAAELVHELGDDADVEAIANVVGSLAVLAGIAAADTICGAALGVRSSSKTHGDAVELLRRVDKGAALAPTLNRLLGAKTRTQYSPSLLSTGQADDMLGWARRLVELAGSF